MEIRRELKIGDFSFAGKPVNRAIQIPAEFDVKAKAICHPIFIVGQSERPSSTITQKQLKAFSDQLMNQLLQSLPGEPNWVKVDVVPTPRTDR